MRIFVNLTCELSRKLRKNPQKKKMKTRENTQNRVQPPKTSPIKQITDRWEPKNSPLQRVTLQCLTSCYRWSNLLRDNVSHLALASAQNPPKNLKISMKNTHFLLVIFNILAPFWHCKVTPYRLEKLGLLLHTSETRSLPRVATKRSTQKCETLKNATEVSGALTNWTSPSQLGTFWIL